MSKTETLPTADRHLGPGETSPTSRHGRRGFLAAVAAAAVLAACNETDEATDAPFGPAELDEPVIDDLVMPEALPLVDDGDGNVAPDLDGPLTLDPAPRDDSPTPSSPSPTTRPSNPTTTRPSNPTTTRPSNPTTTGPTTSLATSTTLAATTTVVARETTTVPPTTTPPTTAPPTTTPVTTAAPTTAPPTTAPPTTAPPTTVPPPPPPAATARLVTSRLTFGITPEIDADIISMGIDGWIEDQLAKNTADPAVERLLGGYRTLAVSLQEADRIDDNDGNVIHEETTHVNFVRARYSTHQLYEMVVQLWMDHFNISLDNNRHMLPDYQERAIRPQAMGSFADLLAATAHAPAMLHYLDNAYSDARRGVNENYGRELLELHTLGIDEQGRHIYTEADVVAASKVMSGWSFERDRNASNYSEFRFRDDYHSTETVSLLGGQWTNAGLPGKAAGDSLLAFLARHPQTATHISYKLCRRFVADRPPAGLVASAAQVYLANDTAIVPVLRHIFASTDFASSDGAKVRRPFELMVAAMRSLGSTIPIRAETNGSDQLRRRLEDLGHRPWYWETPDGYPDEAPPWVNSDGMLKRWDFTARLARDRHTDPNRADPILTDLAALRGNAANGGELFDRLAFRCNLGQLPAALRDQLLALTGVAVDTPAADITDDELIELATYLLAHPLFQLR